MKIKKTAVKTTTNNKGKAAVKPGVAAQAQTKAAEQPKRNGVNTGKVTGLRVMQFQDLTLETNDLARRPAPLSHIPGQLTDTELARVWREEFPNSRAVLNGRITEEIVRGVRNLYNNGTGGHGTEGKTHSSKPWVNLDGKRSQAEYTRARKVGEPKGEAKKAQPAPDAKAVAKTKAKVVTAQAVKAVGKKKVVAKKAA